MSVQALRPSARGAAWCLVLCAACGGRELDWPSVKQGVREEFPDVRSVTVEELRRRLELPEASRPVLLDARSREEFAVSHLKDAVHAPSEAEALAVLANVEKDEPVIVYCSVGQRSAALAQELAARGYSDVANVEGSIFEWANSGLPVYRDGVQVREVHPFDEQWGTLLGRELWSHQP